jgi:hypothetical protein
MESWRQARFAMRADGTCCVRTSQPDARQCDIRLTGDRIDDHFQYGRQGALLGDGEDNARQPFEIHYPNIA